MDFRHLSHAVFLQSFLKCLSRNVPAVGKLVLCGIVLFCDKLCTGRGVVLDSCWLSAIKVCTAAGVFSLNTVCCHLAGFASVLEGIRNNNDLGHPVCENLRAGDWMAGYTAERLKLREDTHEVGRKLNT